MLEFKLQLVPDGIFEWRNKLKLELQRGKSSQKNTVLIMTVPLKTPVNRADCECQEFRLVRVVEQEPVEWGFSRKA